MFCPKCNQQQLSNDVRFCSRCGFPLDVVAELLSYDGFLLSNQMETKESAPLIKRKGLRVGAKIVFLSVFLTVPAFGLAIAFKHPIPLLIAVIPFLIGLAQILYVYLFGESIIPLKGKGKLAELNARESYFSLPKSQSAPTPMFNSKPLDTGEIIQPLSVTEHTTKLLKND
jgi:hypothetical protein